MLYASIIYLKQNNMPLLPYKNLVLVIIFRFSKYILDMLVLRRLGFVIFHMKRDCRCVKTFTIVKRNWFYSSTDDKKIFATTL